ncbi:MULTISPECIES: isoaspartyl peptidase/L-asparaginase family protein [Sulfitobacter]|uniref:Isoaspartyl peptidase n=1 Tax=Sulfitobacter dubius TaxID=218673 RepID=A0ABY3ZRW7_9RHOB|nr:isoaspartyl peptidase/L-asparaginase [Sulfitobacter dubius]UOA16860.1 Isoaspartyl peptidase [Sulfitobacter dubius]WOI30936.1 isoaspartyl peptidase/L-asparaginase [Sulfitobacter dubius]
MTYSLAIHGGAGTLLKRNMTPEKEAAYHAGLARAVEAGEAVLRDGGSAVDAVVASVCALEDEPLFNAGRGAVYTSEGKQEMDAAVMDGRDRRAGSVAGVFGPKNPIRLAHAVMERTEHVTLIGPNALEIAQQAELPFGDHDYFFTQSRWDALQETLELRARGEVSDDPARRHGTVGAVARDEAGNIAAATSTGGMTAKAPGRMGDTPMIGAGTFADNATCAVSGTGHGEIFIRWNAAGEIAARMRHAGEDLATAANHVVMQDLANHDGSGGVIAVDPAGNIAMPFNSQGMYRGMVRKGLAPETSIY